MALAPGPPRSVLSSTSIPLSSILSSFSPRPQTTARQARHPHPLPARGLYSTLLLAHFHGAARLCRLPALNDGGRVARPVLLRTERRVPPCSRASEPWSCTLACSRSSSEYSPGHTPSWRSLLATAVTDTAETALLRLVLFMWLHRLDWYSRYVISWELDQTLQIGFVLEAMQRALTQAGPQICNSDQGRRSLSVSNALLTASGDILRWSTLVRLLLNNRYVNSNVRSPH